MESSYDLMKFADYVMEIVCGCLPVDWNAFLNNFTRLWRYAEDAWY